MTGAFHESPTEDFDGAGHTRGDDVDAAPVHRQRTPRFTRAYAEVVRELLAGRYIVGDAIEWESTPRRRGVEAPIVGAGGPGLLLEGSEVENGVPVSILILDPLLWPDDESFHAARIAANRLSTARDSTLIIPRRVLWEVAARCIVLVLDPVPAPPHRGPGEASVDEQALRRAGVALCRAARTLTRLGQGGITCDEVWFGADAQVRVLRVPGIRREHDHGAAQGVASVMQRMLDGAAITPDSRLNRALRRARTTPRYEDAEALEVLQRALASRSPLRAGATAAFLCAAAILVWLGTGLTWVDANETVTIVNAWGQERTLTHGLHIKWPTPIESTQRSAPAVTLADAGIEGALPESADLTAPGPAPADDFSEVDVAPKPVTNPPLDPTDPASHQPEQFDQEQTTTLAVQFPKQPEQIGVITVAPAEQPLEPELAPEPIEPAGHDVLAPTPLPDEPTALAVVDSAPTPDPIAEPAAASTSAPAEPYPAARLALYFARGSVDQARTAVEELADHLDQLADRRAAATQVGDDNARAVAAETLRILEARGVHAPWLIAARTRIHNAEAALLQGNAPLALQSLDGLADDAIARLQAIAGAHPAAAALAHAQRAEAAWQQTSDLEQSHNRDRAEQALASIAAGRTALAEGDFAAAADHLTLGAQALEQLASQTTVIAARGLEQQAVTLLENWDSEWAHLARAGFSAPEEIALARRHLQTGAEHLVLRAPSEASSEFRAAADLTRRGLARLAEERQRATQIDHRGRTPLHHAALDGDVQRARYALTLGAPVHARDIDGNSPLRLAVTARNLAVARVLLDSGADVNDRAGSGRPLVFDAIRDPAAFMLLLEHGARAGWTVRGSTLLHEIAWARARHGVGDADQVKMAAALLDRGADPTTPDASGETPLQIAERTRAAALADFLRKRAAFGRDLEQATPQAPPHAN